MTPIPVGDFNDQMIEATLDGRSYHLTVSWNEEAQRWTMSVRNLDTDTLVSGIALVSAYPLLQQVRRAELPPGEFIVDAPPGATLDRAAFTTGATYLWYFSADDMLELAAQD